MYNDPWTWCNQQGISQNTKNKRNNLPFNSTKCKLVVFWEKKKCKQRRVNTAIKLIG